MKKTQNGRAFFWKPAALAGYGATILGIAWMKSRSPEQTLLTEIAAFALYAIVVSGPALAASYFIHCGIPPASKGQIRAIAALLTAAAAMAVLLAWTYPML